jgi:DNA-binding SARP family transcriptional activator
MPKLEVQLLGSPVVRTDGVVSRFRTRKTLALLAVLSVTPGAMRREALASLLWDDLEIEAARRELRKTLSYLGDALGTCASMLEVTRHTLELNRDELGSDVERLELAIRGGEPTALEAVIQEYGGEFMLGFEAGGAAFAAWLLEQRESARSALHQACEALFERRLTAHQLPEALEVATLWVRHEPASEVAHRAVMRAHLAAGNPSAALSAFETCRAALARELEASPGAETRHLAEQARTALGLGAPPANLVGRADAWTQLEAVTLGEGATLCLILGEPGMGKSRLALEFAASRHDPLLLRAEITSSLTPLAPVADALRSSLNDPARVARLNALPLAWRVEVARLVPEFGSSADAVVIPTHEGRSRLLEGLTHGLLAALGPHGMLVLDDLHRFDADSAALALGVLRRSPRAALATARAPELEANTEVCAVLEGFERHARLEKLALGALSPLEVTALIRDSGRNASRT